MSTATVNGVDLAYIEHGQGEPVLFAHGGVGDYRAWEQQMNAFGAEFRAIALSCRGYWPNAKLRPGESVTLDTFTGDLAQFVKALDAGPVHLVGHSSPGGFGGLRLVVAAAAVPGGVERAGAQLGVAEGIGGPAPPRPDPGPGARRA